ncbi:hypothetical protein CMI43_03275 [Candidatus Pacearchaeota archaeon]|nr:hypothetical protein [Candidatus Pacearchaeota archaeon]|tara:strand:+ start:130 stop:1032 length:903 start_codon:yes stop_codon:yes gene_type:complete
MKLIYVIILLLLLTGCQPRPQVPPENVPYERYVEPINFTSNETNATKIEIKEDVFLPPKKDNLSIYINDINGQSVIAIKKGISLLIDAGTEDDSQTIIKNLRNLGVNDLDYIILSNKLETSIGGLPYIIIQTSPAIVYEGGKPSPFSSSFNLYKEIYPNATLISTDKLLEFKDAFVKIMVPYDKGQGFLDQQEDNSVITKIKYKENNFLAMSNCHFECIENIKDSDIKADGLIIDGSCDSTTLSFLQKVNPQVVVITGELCSETEDRFNFLDIPIYTTKEHGNIRIETNGNEFYLKYLKQ